MAAVSAAANGDFVTDLVIGRLASRREKLLRYSLSALTAKDPAVGEGTADGAGGGAAVQLLRGCDGPGGQVRHAGAGEVERPLQDDRVRLDVAERLADIPQCPRPDLTVVV